CEHIDDKGLRQLSISRFGLSKEEINNIGKIVGDILNGKSSKDGRNTIPQKIEEFFEASQTNFFLDFEKSNPLAFDPEIVDFFMLNDPIREKQEEKRDSYFSYVIIPIDPHDINAQRTAVYTCMIDIPEKLLYPDINSKELDNILGSLINCLEPLALIVNMIGQKCIRQQMEEEIREESEKAGRKDEWLKVLKGLSHEIKNVISPYNHMIQIAKRTADTPLEQIDDAECCCEYLKFLAGAFSFDLQFDLLPKGMIEVKSCLHCLWEKAISLGMYLNRRVTEDGWRARFYHVSTSAELGFFPEGPQGVSFQEHGVKRLGAELVFMAAFSNFVRHFIPYLAKKHYGLRRTDPIPILTEEVMRFFRAYTSISISTEELVIRNKGFWHEKEDKKVGTDEAIQIAISTRFGWETEGIAVSNPDEGTETERWHELRVKLPVEFWTGRAV
ncbi:MAG: hypothetical protein KAV87_40760, partial [Desulfobacteraceae bacterium]|nr:hypothetical protein [Desulfobacteraceae bacterium]